MSIVLPLFLIFLATPSTRIGFTDPLPNAIPNASLRSSARSFFVSDVRSVKVTEILPPALNVTVVVVFSHCAASAASTFDAESTVTLSPDAGRANAKASVSPKVNFFNFILSSFFTLLVFYIITPHKKVLTLEVNSKPIIMSRQQKIHNFIIIFKLFVVHFVYIVSDFLYNYMRFSLSLVNFRSIY